MYFLLAVLFHHQNQYRLFHNNFEQWYNLISVTYCNLLTHILKCHWKMVQIQKYFNKRFHNVFHLKWFYYLLENYSWMKSVNNYQIQFWFTFCRVYFVQRWTFIGYSFWINAYFWDAITKPSWKIIDDTIRFHIHPHQFNVTAFSSEGCDSSEIQKLYKSISKTSRHI